MFNELPDLPAELNAERLQSLWTDLAGDAPKALDAVWLLSALTAAFATGQLAGPVCAAFLLRHGYGLSSALALAAVLLAVSAVWLSVGTSKRTTVFKGTTSSVVLMLPNNLIQIQGAAKQ